MEAFHILCLIAVARYLHNAGTYRGGIRDSQNDVGLVRGGNECNVPGCFRRLPDFVAGTVFGGIRDRHNIPGYPGIPPTSSGF